MATPVAAVAYAAALNLPDKMMAFLFSSDFGRGGSDETVPLEQILKVKHRLPPTNQM
jgi:hypothetical protein